ncbi:MAG TPA: hypothetical protein VF339_11135 [Gammaproteobacteria bacterium]
MKYASVWVIASGTAMSLILGLAAPVEQTAQRRASGSDVAANGVCAPFIANDVRYAEVELRLDAPEPRTRFEF